MLALNNRLWTSGPGRTRQGAHRQWTATLGLHQGGRTAAVVARALAGERFPGVRDTFVTHRSLRRMVDEVVHTMVRALWQSGGSLGPLLHAEDADGAAAVLCRSALAPAPPAVAAAPVAAREEWGVPRWQHRQAPPHRGQRRGVLTPEQVLHAWPRIQAVCDAARAERLLARALDRAAVVRVAGRAGSVAWGRGVRGHRGAAPSRDPARRAWRGRGAASSAR